MIHILAGSATDVDLFLEAAAMGKSLPWRGPKKSRVGDPVLIYLWGIGFTTRGVIASEPREHEPGRYTAKVGSIVPLASAVPLAFIQENHSSWKWLSAYTKSYTTIDGAIEARLEELLNEYQGSFAMPLTEGTSKSISVTAYERNPLARQQCIAHLWG